ncbi:hypothetical protein GCM10010971_02360 [Silvimonas amylolytica]|uniref:Uncharacterized protein n=1 Tax=Silvimonas amylolytica TaxID=449663 RepID=A0ABQ2PFQ9_9NEIS|nr:hypothetical protein GCM10010971_02360 [Silvimonas amylolytica]
MQGQEKYGAHMQKPRRNGNGVERGCMLEVAGQRKCANPGCRSKPDRNGVNRAACSHLPDPKCGAYNRRRDAIAFECARTGWPA